MSSQAGKGDKPRNCYSKRFKDNYSQINWGSNKKIDKAFAASQAPSREGKDSQKSNSNSQESLPS